MGWWAAATRDRGYRLAVDWSIDTIIFAGFESVAIVPLAIATYGMPLVTLQPVSKCQLNGFWIEAYLHFPRFTHLAASFGFLT